MYGYEVGCQMNSKEDENYVYACVVGHTRKMSLILVLLHVKRKNNLVNHVGRVTENHFEKFAVFHCK